MSKERTDIWLFCFRKWDINWSNFFTSVILEWTGFSVRMGSRSCTYWLKYEFANFVISCGRTHLNWLRWFKMVSLFEGCWFSILSDLSLSLPCTGKFHVFSLCLFFFLLLRLSLLLELDEEEQQLEEVEVKLLLLFRFSLFILWTFLRLLFSLSFLVN